MAGFLAAAIQARLASFIIVIEMVEARAMGLSLTAWTLVASSVSRVLFRTLYATFARLQLRRPPPTEDGPARSHSESRNGSPLGGSNEDALLLVADCRLERQ